MATTFPTAQADDHPVVHLISTSRAGRAGVTAAGVMLAVQLIWRLNWSDNGVVQAFPEFIAAAIARLTPLSIFGAATENYGSLAKKSLFVAVLFGVLLVGYQAGRTAGKMSNQIGADDRRFPARALGEIVIVEVGDNISIGLVTLSVQEMSVGDLVMQQTR